MPYVANAQDNEEEKQNQPSSQGAVAPVGGGGGAVRLSPSGGVASVGGAGTPSTPGAGGASPSSSSSAGGQFASLNQYLNANQGQAAPLAGKITSGINDQYNNLNTQNTSTLGGINQQVSANATPTNYNDTLTQEAANPVSFASNPGNVASFQSLLNASYGGPASAEGTTGYQTQQNAVNSAIAAGQNATGTEAGREGLLTQNESTPTTGVTALNSAILSQDPNALNSIETAYQPFSGLLNNLQTGASSIDQQIAQNQNNATQANQASNAAINNQIGTFNSGLNTELSNATTARDAYNTAIQANQNTWNPVNTDINSLNEILGNITKGLTPVVGGSASVNNPLGTYVNAPLSTTAPALTSVATPQDYAQAQAFQTLLGNLNTGAPTPIINASTVNQAGTYSAPTAPTITNPKAEAQTLADAIAATKGADTMGANNTVTNTANPWFTAANPGQNPTYEQNMQQTQPIYADLQKLLNQIYGGQIVNQYGLGE